MVEPDRKENKRLEASIKLYRNPFAYAEMEEFLFHRIGRPVDPNEVVSAVAAIRDVKQIHAFNWNQLAVVYEA